MKLKYMNAVLISIISFIAFYLVTTSALLAPFAPSKMAVVIMRYGLFVVIVVAAIYFGFFHRWSAIKTTSWEYIMAKIPRKRDRVFRLGQYVVVIPLFSALMVYCVESWMAFPTELFADEAVSIEAECHEKNRWGKSSRNMVMIVAEDKERHTQIKFPWQAGRAPECPGRIKITGKQWIFGIHVLDVTE